MLLIAILSADEFCFRIAGAMEVILNADEIKAVIDDLADRITAANPADTGIAVIGIRSRGEILAQRLSKKLGESVPCGALDIVLYRDDINDHHGDAQPVVRSTEIPFDINEKIIILVDDVLYTGRSVRSAMDALIDLGRPKAVRLAVLVDRGHHELPIQADFAGLKVDISPEESVEVNLVETDEKDQVIVQ